MGAGEGQVAQCDTGDRYPQESLPHVSLPLPGPRGAWLHSLLETQVSGRHHSNGSSDDTVSGPSLGWLSVGMSPTLCPPYPSSLTACVCVCRGGVTGMENELREQS